MKKLLYVLLAISAFASAQSKIDVASLITPNASGLGNNYLLGSTPCVTYVGPPDANGSFPIVQMKGLSGEPWDWLIAHNDYIGELLTELKWSQWNTGKMTAPATGGQPRFPRWISYTYPSFTPSIASAPGEVPNLVASLISAPNSAPITPIPGQWQFTVHRPQTDYFIIDSTDTTSKTYGNVISRNTDNYVRDTFMGPFPGAAVGDIPAGEDWLGVYEWAGKLVNGQVVYNGTKEIKYFRSVLNPDGTRSNWGQYKWESYPWNAATNSYAATPSSSSFCTKRLPLPATAIVPKQMIF